MAGDAFEAGRAEAAALFQSTPTNFMAGDSRSWPASPRLWMFQSTPTNFMAGDIGATFLGI